MSKVPWKNVFAGFQCTVFKSKITFLKKSCTTTLTHRKARHVWDLFSTKQGNR